MKLENISEEDLLIKEALIQWSNEKADRYIEKNKIAMDAKMHYALNQLYLNKNRKNNIN